MGQDRGRADAAGKKTAVGAIVIVNAIVGWQTLAEIARNAQGTAVDVVATSVALTEAKSVASAKGAKSSDDGGKSGDQESTGAVNGDNANTQGTKTQTASMPTSNGGTNGSNGAQGANNAQAGQSGQSSSSSSSGGSSTTEVAAAVAVNWLVASSTARIAASTTVTATTGAVSVISLFTLGANAFAMGSAIDLEHDGSRVGAAIGLNVQDVDNIAIVGGGAHLTGHDRGDRPRVGARRRAQRLHRLGIRGGRRQEHVGRRQRRSPDHAPDHGGIDRRRSRDRRSCR